MTIWSAGYKIRSISLLEEEEALSRGADILSESFIFAVSGGIVVYEYNRSSEKEKKKEEARLQKIRDEATRLQAKLNSLDKRLVALEEYAKANRRSIILGIGVGANGRYVGPDSVVPINDDESDENDAILGATTPSMDGKAGTKEHVAHLVEDSRIPHHSSADASKDSSKTTQHSWRWLWPFP